MHSPCVWVVLFFPFPLGRRDGERDNSKSNIKSIDEWSIFVESHIYRSVCRLPVTKTERILLNILAVSVAIFQFKGQTLYPTVNSPIQLTHAVPPTVTGITTAISTANTSTNITLPLSMTAQGRHFE